MPEGTAHPDHAHRVLRHTCQLLVSCTTFSGKGAVAGRPELLTIKPGNGSMGALMEVYCDVEGLNTFMNVSCKCCRPEVGGRQWGQTVVGSGRGHPTRTMGKVSRSMGQLP